MGQITRKTTSLILRAIIKPIAGFCVRHGIRVQDLSDFIKSALLEAATSMLEAENTKATASRLSAITGLQRREVEKYSGRDIELDDSRDLIRKVIGFWQSGEQFVTKGGDPRVLSYGTDGSEFSDLVRAVSKDLNAATILFELERLKIVEKTSRGARLVLDSFSPRGDAEAGFRVVAEDIHDLILSGEDNLFTDSVPPQLHVRTNYDRIRQDAVPEIKQWLLREGHAFHARARDFISQYDQDINPELSYRGKTTNITVTSFGRAGFGKKEKGNG